MKVYRVNPNKGAIPITPAGAWSKTKGIATESYITLESNWNTT